MTSFLKPFPAATVLCAVLFMSFQSCDDNTPSAKQKVHFTFSTGTTAGTGRAHDTDLPEGTHLRISIETSTGTSVFTNHDVNILKAGGAYIADPVELTPGTYAITDFMIVNAGELLYATPKAGAPLSHLVTHALPHSFTVTNGSAANVEMQVIDAREHAPEDLGYASFTANIVNVLSVSVFSGKNGNATLVAATAELRQEKTLIKKIDLQAGTTTLGFEGDPGDDYTLAVYTKDEGKVMTFNFAELKAQLGNSPLKVTLEPALVLTMESNTPLDSDWEDTYALYLDGAGGNIHVDWGDGHTATGALPTTPEHQYTAGNYTAIVTGDLNAITDFFGFAYETYMIAINGLTNLTALKTFNPSWGAVPIHVDLSKCENLETIFIEKYGVPYDPIDLRTDFKLPAKHWISEFVFYVPSLEEFREPITAEELDVMVTNIYDNATQRNLYDGRFFVSPVDEPLPETQQKLDFLQNYFGWTIGLNSDDIYEDEHSESGRGTITAAERRERWLRERRASTDQRQFSVRR